MANRYYTGAVTDHFNGKQFFHPGLPSTDKSLLDSIPLEVVQQTCPLASRSSRRIPASNLIPA